MTIHEKIALRKSAKANVGERQEVGVKRPERETVRTAEDALQIVVGSQ